MFCSLKISGASKNYDREKETKNPYPSKNYYLKITIMSKNCRLKITAMSKNYDLKILVRVRVYARAYDCQDYTKEEHDQNTRPPEKGGTQAKQILRLLGDLHAKTKKSKKKFANKKKGCNFVAVIKTKAI